MSAKQNTCTNWVLFGAAAVGAALVGYTLYQQYKTTVDPVVTHLTVPTSPAAVLGTLRQESSTLPLKFQYEGIAPDPARQPLLTHHPHHIYPKLKRFIPGQKMWMVQFEIPAEGDTLWQFKLRGPNVAKSFRKAILFFDKNEISTLDARKREHYTVLQNGDVAMHFTNKPFWLRGMDTHDLHVQIFFDGSAGYVPPKNVILTPIYGKGHVRSKRMFGEKWVDRLTTADGVPMTIFYGPSGRVRIEHPHYQVDYRKRGKHTPTEDHPDFRPNMANMFHYMQLGNIGWE